MITDDEILLLGDKSAGTLDGGERIEHTLAFIAGFKQASEMSEWVDVQTDIVIPNEMLLVQYHNGENEVIFYDELRLPNFRWYIPISNLPQPPKQR